MSTTSSKISQFVSRTGSSNKVAQELLKDNNWNVECAVNAYKLMNEASVIPKKNVNAKQNCMDAASRHLSHDFRATNKIKPVAQDFCLNSIEIMANNVRNENSGNSNSSNGKGRNGRTSEALRPFDPVRQNPPVPPSSSSPSASEDPSDTIFILPDFSAYAEDFRNFLDKDLIETSTLDLLMKAGRLNWWSEFGCQPLFPLVTTGDGNCLLHAASLALWGHQDTDLTLRKRLYDMMVESPHHEAFFRRWKWHQMQINKQADLVYSESEWQEEWNSLVRLASPQPRIGSSGNAEPNQGSASAPSSSTLTTAAVTTTMMTNHETQNNVDQHNTGHPFDQQEIQYESLEELHIFVLAHLLRRPIVITADTILKDSKGEALAPITFGGVYLPLELPPSVCHRYPILLTYDAAHFSALVPTEDGFRPLEATRREAEGCHAFSGSIPLVDVDLELLPVHFVRDPGPNCNWGEEERAADIATATLAAEGKHEDGGERCNGLDEGRTSGCREVPLVEKVSALRTYLEVEVIPVPTVVDSSLEGGETGRIGHREPPEGAATVQRGSSAGGTSEDSNEARSGEESRPKPRSEQSITNDLFGTSEQEKRDKRPDKNKSLGRLKKIARSVGANFKKSFNVAGSNKGSGNKVAASSKAQQVKVRDPRCEGPVASPEVSSNAVAFVVDSLEKKSRIPCARLLYKRQDYQTEIINNYLEQALERFQASRKRELERMHQGPPSASSLHHHSTADKSFEPSFRRGSQQSVGSLTSGSRQQPRVGPAPIRCVNSGCSGRSTSDTCYLCSDCYEKQRSEEAKIKNNSNNNGQSNGESSNRKEERLADPRRPSKHPDPSRPPPGAPKSIVAPSVLRSSLSDDFGSASSRIVLEKYTSKTSGLADGSVLVATETTESDFHSGRSGGSEGGAFSRVSVERQGRPATGQKGGRCATEGCNFYGSRLTDHYCSSCYRKRNAG